MAQPALLVPLAEVGSVEFARAAGASATFDLLLHARDGATHEVPLARSAWDPAAARASKRLCIAFMSCITLPPLHQQSAVAWTAPSW